MKNFGNGKNFGVSFLAFKCSICKVVPYFHQTVNLAVNIPAYLSEIMAEHSGALVRGTTLKAESKIKAILQVS